MSLSPAGQRAEAVLASKAEVDHAGLSAVFAGAALSRFGSCVATRLPALADLAPYNKARGFGPDERDQLDDIINFYDVVGVRPAVEVCEPDASEQFNGLLRGANFAPAANGVTLHTTPTLRPEPQVAGLVPSGSRSAHGS